MRKIAYLALLLCLLGCGDTQKAKLLKGVEQAERTFRLLETNLQARLNFQDIMSQGSSLLTVVTANMDDAKQYPPFYMDKPQKEWSVVLRYNEPTNEVIIEGYETDLTKASLIKRVKLPALEE